MQPAGYLNYSWWNGLTKFSQTLRGSDNVFKVKPKN